MNCLPVIEMEMRSASRRKRTFGLRFLFGAVGSGACLVVLTIPGQSASQKGQVMLVVLSLLSLLFCLTAGGLLTADCVSSERREGTLGLLFLTPLSGLDIVLGKLACHGLQLFYAACAVGPVFFLPLLAGGVTWPEVSRVLLALALALLLSACVGILVSVGGTESRKTMMATISSILLITAVPMLYYLIREVFFSVRAQSPGLSLLSPLYAVLMAFDRNYRLGNGPGMFWGSAGTLFVLSLLTILLASRRLGRAFHPIENSLTKAPRRVPFRARLPVFDHSPYEWLVLKSSGDARSLGLINHGLVSFFLVMLCVSVTTTHWQSGFISAFFTALGIHVLNKLRLAVEATRQIHLDQRSGVLEHLLATPLSERSIMNGHHRAVQKISRRSLALLILINILLELWVLLFPKQLHIDAESLLIFSCLFVGGLLLAFADFWTLRWLAVVQALRSSTHVKASLMTFGYTMLVPWIAMGIAFAFLAGTNARAFSFALVVSSWVIFSLVYDVLLVRHTISRLGVGLRVLASEQFSSAA